MQYSTPNEDSGWKFWLLIAALLVAWIGFIATAEAAEEPKEQKVDVVHEESTCNIVLESFQGHQLVQLQISPDTLEAVAVYLKKTGRDSGELTVLARPACGQPWRLIRQMPVKLSPPKPKCENTPTSQCL